MLPRFPFLLPCAAAFTASLTIPRSDLAARNYLYRNQKETLEPAQSEILTPAR
jgi:hypothetical protein